MQASLLRTKLHRPAPAPVSVLRRRLLSHLQAGLQSKVTLVSAAAGSGKTTLLSTWLDQLTAQSSAPEALHTLKVSWLTVDQTDDQLPHFLHYLVAAIEENFPHSCVTVTALLQKNPDPSIEGLADALTNSLALLSAKLVLVLDDLHLLDNVAIYALLARLIQYAPPTFHLVLSARVDPPLPLNRWRAQGLLNELRLQDLYFTVAEASTFLTQNLANPPTAEVVATLHKYTEGWAVGLRLAALALRGHADPTIFLADIAANRNRYIIDYLSDDVLEQQPVEIQQFLLSTAILKRFCPALCAAVLAIDESAAQQQLDEVARANLFLVDLSSPRLWVRYHHQFQSMLLAKLHEQYPQPTIHTLYRRAATWLAERGGISEPLYYLTAIADFDLAADLLESQRTTLLNEQRFHELAEALTLIPPQLRDQRPVLLISVAWIQSWRLERTQCAATLQRIEQLLSEPASNLAEPTRQILQLEMVALQIALGNLQSSAEALTLIQTAWAHARPYLAYIHSDVVTLLADTCQRLGAVDTGLAIIATALEYTTHWPPIVRCSLLNMRGLLYFWDCKLSQAERTFQANLHEARQHGFELIAVLCQLVLGVIACARHQLDTAEPYLQAVLTDLHWESGRYAMLSLRKLIELYTFQGCPERTRPLIERLKAYALLTGLSYLQDHVAALEAHLAMTCDDLPGALGWALQESHDALNTSMYGMADRIPLTRACILLAEGSPASLHKASQLLNALSGYQESQHQWYYLVEALVFQALTWAKLGQMELALSALGKAVQRAVPNGMIGLFIQQGQPMKQLLYALRKQPQSAPLVELLLAAFPVDSASKLGAVLESLTDRETAVLQLLADGLSNKEIAQRLIVSAHTVRNHTANIFGKLQVENRLQAVERARALGLLPA